MTMTDAAIRPAEQKAVGAIYGLLNLAVAFAIVSGLWHLFLNPNGVLALYTPMYGFSLLVAFVASIVLIAKVADFYPLEGASLGTVQWGIVRTVAAVLATMFLVYGFFWGFIGRYGITYFSPYSIIAAGGVGAELFNARENASTAIVYVFTAFLWVALSWSAGFGQWPWVGVAPGPAALARLAIVALLTTVAYVVLFHPHVCYLFYPAQKMAGVEPWWAGWAMTSSAYYNLGLVLCMLLWVVVSDTLWEGYPWRIVDRAGEGNLRRGLFLLAGTFVLGVATFVILLQGMKVAWLEPFEGGQYTDATYFRYLHAGEIATFVALAAFIVKNYFGNLGHGPNLWARAAIRTGVAAAGGAALYLFYYSPLANAMLGKVAGIAQPEDTPLVWTMLFLSVVLIQAEFFAGWPFAKQARS